MEALTIADIKHLKKSDLQTALLQALNAQQQRYHRAEEPTPNLNFAEKTNKVHSLFYQMAGSFQALRERFNIKPLYKD